MALHADSQTAPGATHHSAETRRQASRSSFDTLPATAYMRLPQVLEIIPISPATLWRWVKQRRIAAPVKLGEQVSAWKVGDIRDWLAAQAGEGK